MATRNKEQTASKNPDALIVDRVSFLSKLIERITLGKELLERKVTSVEELEQNEKDYYKWNDYNSEYLKQCFNNEDNEYKVRYDQVNSLGGLIFGGYDNSRQKRLKDLKEDIGSKVTFLEKLIEKIDLLKSKVESKTPIKLIEPKINHAANTNVFIVHGHNLAVLQTVARAIEKLGLTPIILHEQANAGKTIIEKFEANSQVGFVIVLLTDDDEGKAKTEIDLKKRARQNVVLELGYFIGKLGRDRVLPLYSEGVELPSDIYGLLYVHIDKAETWKFAMIKELKAANYNVDANKLL